MPSQNVLDINDLNFESEVLESKEPFVLDFGASWCGPCKRLVPIIEDIARDYEGRLRVGALDTDSSPLVMSRVGVRAVPTIVVFRNGREIARHVGLTTKAKLLSMVGDGLDGVVAANGVTPAT
jgi:thioredoxin 1